MATNLNCLSPNHTNKNSRYSSSCWFFTLLNSSNRKLNVVSPQDDQANFQVSNEVQTGQTVSKEEYDRVLQEMNSLKFQLRRKDEEIDELKNQVSRLIRDKDWLISGCDKDPLIQQIIYTYLSQTRDKTGSSSNNTEQQSVARTDSTVVNRDQNKEKAIKDGKTQPDIVGARATPLAPLYRPHVHGGGTDPWPTHESTDPYAQIFEQIRKEKQLSKEELTSRLRTLVRLPNINLCYTDIFRTLEGKGLVTPQSPKTDESTLQSNTSYLQICEYHKGGRGHSTENCSQLRLQVEKLIMDGVIKIEPPNLVVVQNKSSIPKFGDWN